MRRPCQRHSFPPDSPDIKHLELLAFLLANRHDRQFALALDRTIAAFEEQTHAWLTYLAAPYQSHAA